MAHVRASGPRRPETLLQQSGEPIFLLGPSGRFLYVNPAWEELTGASAAEVVQRDAEAADDSGPADLLDGFRPPPEAVGGAPASATTMIRRPDGQRLWRRLEFWPHRDREGRALFLLGVVRPMEDTPLAPDSPAMRLRARLWRVREQLVERLGTDAIVGHGPAHRRLLDQVDAAASSAVPALIVGPPGSGKRQVARAIHRRSGRPDASLVHLDCAALPADLLDRELFARPTAEGDRPRLSRNDGTLVLQNLIDLPRDVQHRLVESLSGSDRPGIRLLATTSVDPEAAVRDDRLRADLYFALSTMTIPLAPLRERLEEIPVLAQHFLDRANRRGGPRRLGFLPEAIAVLIRYDWPGNLRELSRVVELALERSPGDLIGPDDLPPAIRGHLGSAYLPPPMPEEQLPLDAMLERLERRLLERALRSARGNKSLAAKILHVSRTRLHRRIQELGLSGDPDSDSPDVEPSPDRNGA